MNILIRDFESLGDWKLVLAFIEAANNHFVTARDYPPEDLISSVGARLIILGGNLREGFHHLPPEAGFELQRAFCEALAGEPPQVLVDVDDAVLLCEFLNAWRQRGGTNLSGAELTRLITDFFVAEGTTIFSFNRDRTALRFLASHSLREDIMRKLPQFEIPVGSGIAGWVLTNMEPTLIKDASKNDRFNRFVDKELSFKTRDMLAVPVISGEEAIGVVQVINRRDRGFNESDLRHMEFVSQLVANFLERESLLEQSTHLQRQVGKAQIATSVLHNIGNVLNSVKISASFAQQQIKRTKLGRLKISARLIHENRDNLADFLSNNSKGQLIPEYLPVLVQQLTQEHDELSYEIEKIASKTNLMKDIIETQQTIARGGSAETQDLIEIIEESLGIHHELIKEFQVRIEKDFRTGKPIRAQKAKVAHILINLIKNGIEAMRDTPTTQRYLRLSTEEDDLGCIHFQISDGGVGITSKQMERMFTHGFTTKEDGHGFGLSYCKKIMEEMDGSIEVTSQGKGLGTTFELVFPQQVRRIHHVSETDRGTGQES